MTTKRNNETLQLIALPKTSAASLSFPVRIIWRGRLGGALPKSARLLRQEIDFPAPVVVSQQDDADFGIPVGPCLVPSRISVNILDSNSLRQVSGLPVGNN